MCIVKFCNTLNMLVSCVAFDGVRLYWKTRLFSGASKVLNVKEVAMPNAAPAPRRDQNRSAFCVVDAVTTEPLARTTVVERRLSSVRPLRREIKP